MAELPPPPDYAREPVWDGDIAHPGMVDVQRISYEAAEYHCGRWHRGLDVKLRDEVMSREHVRFEQAYIGANIRLYRFYGADFWLARDEHAAPVSLIVARPGKSPRKNGWGRYVNHYLAYTSVSHRRQGYATSAEKILRRMWADDGYDRVKTLCQSWLGFCYHEHLRDQVWGVKTLTGELVVDSPLHGGPWPEGVPIKSRQANRSGAEMTDEELIAHLTWEGGRFRRDPEEVRAVLAKRAYRRGD